MNAKSLFRRPRALAMLSLTVATSSLHGTDWNVVCLDAALAKVQPDEQLVRLGDMQVPVRTVRAWRNQLAGGPTPKSAFGGGVTLWPAGKVYFIFDGTVSAAKQRAFLDAAAEWSMLANLQFLPRTAQANYVRVLENPSLGGGQSAVGMVGGEQLYQIGPTAWNRATLVHELGHTLGLVHEHQRSDRDAYVTILTNNILSGQEGNFVKLPTSNNQGAYDFFSVMHYARNTLSVNPTTLNTIEPLPAYSQYLNLFGKGDPVLTPSDRAGMVNLYGAAAPLTAVVTNTADSGPGTLRAALYYASDHPGTTITFNIPVTDAGFSNGVFNLLPTDAFPSLIKSVNLNGASQPTNSNPNGPEILLNGMLCPTPGFFANGLKLAGSNCVARGFIISGFPGYGVLVDGTNVSGNTVAGCYLGVNASGTAAVTNGICPIQLSGGARSNTVGGTTAVDRNVIGGSRYQGLVIRDAGTANNTVLGNYVGLNAAGTAPLPNTWAGIGIFGGAQSNRIGGPTPGSFNIISGNSNQGVTITDPNTTGNVVDGNYIGLNPAGTSAIPNGWSGVDIFNGASGNTVGGGAPGVHNVISGNGNQGIAISGAGTSGNVVQGNYIGLNATATGAVSNNWSGVAIYNGAQSNQVGVAGWGNVISGNGNQGVTLSGNNTKGNRVAANYIGLRPDGVTAQGNGWSGLAFYDGAQSNFVGGTSVAMRNVISGNMNQGVVVADPGTSGNVVAGNFIGLNAAGTAAVANLFPGVNFFNGPDGNLLGGTAPGAGNVISGNAMQGVLFQSSGTRSNAVQGNLIGLNAAGNAALANAWSGIEIYNQPSGNLIGGGPGARNFVSGNGNYGVAIDTGSAGNVVQGNTIGLNATTGAAIPNAYTGVVLFNGAVSNLIGGVTAGAANLISGGATDGVQLFDASTTNNSVRGNSIFNNAGVGLALYNTANRNQSAPTLTSATVTTNTTIAGSLTSAANTTFQLDFYADAPPAASAEGMTSLGARTVTTSAGGSATFTHTFGAVLPAGRAVTATATDPAGNTSRFSTGVAVTMTSTVNDGIPDAWRARYFGGAGNTTNAQTCALCDFDNDGLNNRAEFLAGTNPTNAASLLKLVALPPAGSGDVAVLASAPGVVYRLLGSDDAGTGIWSLLADQVIGTGGSLVLNDPAALSQPRRVYRAQVAW